MKKNLIRVLHVTEMLSAAGIESFIMNVYRKIDREKVQFDFLLLRNQKEFYEDEVIKLGGKKYFIESKFKNTFLRIIDESFQIYKFLKNNKFDVIHIHYTTPLRAPYLLAAKMAGVKVRIYHSHSAYVEGKSNYKLLIYKYFRKKISSWATSFFACSNAAAKWMFEPKIIDTEVNVINNGIDVEKYKFDFLARKEIREKNNIREDAFVLIHTGRFSEQKNQSFIIELLSEIRKIDNNVYLFLIGEGNLKKEIQEKASMLGVSDIVNFVGITPEVNKYLSAADCYVMPSLYEGLPVAAIEAQCAGLPCIFSQNITQEVSLTPNNYFLNLEDSILLWRDKIIALKKYKRYDNSSETIEKGYDIGKTTDNLQNFYINSAKKTKENDE